MANATRALGTTLGIGSPAVVVGLLTSIGGVDASAETIDVTALDSTGGYRKFLAGFKDGGEVAVSGFFDPTDPGQMDVYEAFESGAEVPIVITFPASLGATWTFQAIVTGFSTAADVEEALTFEGTLKVSGPPVLAVTP
jgi:predicted secreted protein